MRHTNPKDTEDEIYIGDCKSETIVDHGDTITYWRDRQNISASKNAGESMMDCYWRTRKFLEDAGKPGTIGNSGGVL